MMKKTISAVLALLMLTGCSGSLVNLQYKDGQLINKRLGLAYNAAPTNYEPVAVGDEYGYYGDMDMTLYEISGLSPKKWLTQAYAGSATTIFYSDDQALPTLTEMAPEKIHVCENEGRTMSIATVDDKAVVDQLVALYMDGEAVEWPMVDSVADYELKFVSATYPNLYYNLNYYEYEEGIYIYDRNAKRCVEIGDLLDAWVENSWSE